LPLNPVKNNIFSHAKIGILGLMDKNDANFCRFYSSGQKNHAKMMFSSEYANQNAPTLARGVL